MSNLYDMPPEIQVTAEGGLRIITLNRPDELNASSTEMLFSFPRLFQGLAQDAEARVAILTGAGRAFSAGGDFQHFVKTLDDSEFARSVQENARRTIHSFIDLPIPIIAAVNGPAVGWGATLATLCDIVLMSERAFIAEPHINIGLVVGDGISVSWPLYMSLLRAKELIFTGDRIPPQQAVEFGLANRVVPPEQLLDEARKLADKLLQQPRHALRETKKIMNLYLHQTAAQILDTTSPGSLRQRSAKNITPSPRHSSPNRNATRQKDSLIRRTLGRHRTRQAARAGTHRTHTSESAAIGVSKPLIPVTYNTEQRIKTRITEPLGTKYPLHRPPLLVPNATAERDSLTGTRVHAAAVPAARREKEI